MKINKNKRLLFYGLSLIGWGLTFKAFLDTRQYFYERTIVEPYNKFWIIENLTWGILGMIGLVIIYSWFGGITKIISWFEKRWNFIFQVFSKKQKLIVTLLTLLFFVYPLAVVIFGEYLVSLYPRVWLFCIVLVFEGALLKLYWQDHSWSQVWGFTVLLTGASFITASFVPHVSTYLFALDWSEGSRYFYASLFFDEQLYGLDLPLPHRDLTRYFFQSLPYVIPNSPLWLHRFWQAFMRLTFPFLASFFLVRQMNPANTTKKWGAVLWCAMFIIQGPVFYPMLLLLVFMFWGYDEQNNKKTTMVVIFVSLVAGITRLNWIPMPGIIAAVFYFMHHPLSGKDVRSFINYLTLPAIWVILGTILGWGAQSIYYANSSLPPSMFESSFTSDLLWYRLWPNPSYSLGIVLSVMLVALPLLIFIATGLWAERKNVSWLRLFALSSIILVFFLGGLVVSVKIGGGTNLHNMDTFLILIMLIGVTIYFGRFIKEDSKPININGSTWLTSIILMTPVLFLLVTTRNFTMLNSKHSEHEYQTIQSEVFQIAQAGEEILFIAERHFPLFDQIDEIPMVYDYDRLILMEMVMSRNQEYLTAFQNDLNNQRFGLIITAKLGPVNHYKDPEIAPLAEENNLYTDAVVNFIHCNYTSLHWLRETHTQLWVPKAESTC